MFSAVTPPGALHTAFASALGDVPRRGARERFGSAAGPLRVKAEDSIPDTLVKSALLRVGQSCPSADGRGELVIVHVVGGTGQGNLRCGHAGRGRVFAGEVPREGNDAFGNADGRDAANHAGGNGEARGPGAHLAGAAVH